MPVVQSRALPVDALGMREDVHYDGVDLSRLAPVAWLATFALAFGANAFAASGYGVSHVRMQTLVVMTLFAGMMAMTGTAQWVRHYLDTGRYGRAWIVTAMVLAVAVIVLGLAFPDYSSL